MASVQFSRSVVSVSLRTMNCSMPGLPVHHQLPEFTQTHVHRVSDAIQPSHLSSPSPPAPSPSQHQSLFQSINSSHAVAKVLEFQLQHHSFQRNPRAGLLQNGLVGSPCSPRDSEGSSPTPQFKSINSSALSLLHSPTLTSIHDHRKNHSLDQLLRIVLFVCLFALPCGMQDLSFPLHWEHAVLTTGPPETSRLIITLLSGLLWVSRRVCLRQLRVRS